MKIILNPLERLVIGSQGIFFPVDLKAGKSKKEQQNSRILH